jgi:hypothetical protein
MLGVTTIGLGQLHKSTELLLFQRSNVIPWAQPGVETLSSVFQHSVPSLLTQSKTKYSTTCALGTMLNVFQIIHLISSTTLGCKYSYHDYLKDEKIKAQKV